MNIKNGLSIFISAVMVFSPITSVRAYDADDDKAVIESPAVSNNDISEDKAVITHEVPKVKASSGTCGDDLTWTLDDNGTLTISGTGDMENYSWYDAPWYDNRSNVKTLIIDDRVTSIGSSAFHNCAGLTSVTIPDGVTSIGGYAFKGCSSLTSIAIPDAVTSIGEYAFSFCLSLVSVTIPDGVTSIGGGVFNGCSNLTTVTLPDTVTSIDEYTFSFCSSLVSVTMGDSVTSIGDYAFECCSSLTSVTIPDTVTSIGEYAFDCCEILTKVYITDIAKWCGINFENSHSNPLYYKASLYLNDEVLTNLVITDGVTSIGEYAFYKCSSLTSVTIPDSVTSIGDYVFYSCSSLNSVTIGNGVTSIGNRAFGDCTSLAKVFVTDIAKWCGISFYSYTSCPLYNGAKLYVKGEELKGDIVLPEEVSKIGSYAFYKCSSLTSVTIPDGVTSIGEHAFYECSNLTSVTIPDSVTSIGEHAFYECSSLTSVTIPDGVTSIGKYAFYNCSGLTLRAIPNGVTSIGESAFYNCSSITLTMIPDGVISIGDGAFYNCSSITSVTIPNSVTSIGEYVFADCSNLTSVTIGNNVTNISYGAFADCSSLVSVIIGDGVTRIGYDAFIACTSLTSVTIGNSVVSIGDYAFKDCTSLTSVTFPDSVTTIEFEAFFGCESLESVYITSIESWNNISFNDSFSNPFNYAEKLYLNGELVTNLVFPDGITTVRSDPFSNIKSIKSLVIPEGVVSIQETAFTGDINIETVTLPKSLVKINADAFSRCYAIKKVYYPGSEAEWNDILISSGNDNLKNAEIVYGVIVDDDGESGDNSHGSHLAMGTLGTSQWVLFEDGTAIINGTGALEFTDIPFYKYRDTVTSVKISDGITSIPEDMFYKCEKITKVIIPKSVKSIGDSAFWRCSGITEVYYGGTAEEWNDITIGEYNDALSGASFTYSYSAVTEVGIKFLANPPKKAYSYGEELALDNTVIVKKYSDGSFTEIEDYTVTGYDKYTFGRQDVSITYGTHTIDFAVSVKPMEAKALTAPVTAGMTVEEFSAPYSALYTVFVFDSDKMTLLSSDDVIRSGSVVQFVRDGAVVDSIAVNVGGDATGDGVVNGKDLIRIKKQILDGNAVEYTEFADINRDGIVDEADIDALMNMI